MKYTFPDDFLFGASVWATGTEGAAYSDGKSETVWDRGYRFDPGRFYERVSPDDTLDMYHDYHQEVEAVRKMGLTSYRTSVLWSRLIPDGINVNHKAAEYYRNMFRAFKEQGVFLSVVLYWFDMPAYLEDKGGFSNPAIIDDFVYYCQKCFELFDGLADGWFIYNEPIMDVLFKYQIGICYPWQCDIAKSLKACYNMIIAHRKAVEVFKKTGTKGRIGTVLNQGIVYPRSQNPEDLQAAGMYRLVNYEVFEKPLLKGEISAEWLKFRQKFADIEAVESNSQLIKNNTVSFLGINIYTPIRVKGRETVEIQEPIRMDYVKSSFWEHYRNPEGHFNKDRGWEIYPQVIYDLLIRNKQEYPDVEMMITENGIGIHGESVYRNRYGIIEDDYRIEFISEHLKYVHKALKEGVRLMGYNVWSLVDLWSPTSQFKNCYGLYEYDRDSKKIREKKSAKWYAELIKHRGFEGE